MRRSTLVFVFGLVGAMALVALAVTVWRWDGFAQADALAHRKLVVTTFALVFMPLWLGLGAFGMNWALTRPSLKLADDTRRVAENSLIAATLLMVGVQLWTAAGAVLGGPPGGEFGVRLVEAIAGVYFIVNANFAAKTSPPQGWPDPGRWTRATLRTGWVGVAAGVVILACAIAGPMEPMVWIVGGATVVYAAAAVLNHVALRRKPA